MFGLLKYACKKINVGMYENIAFPQCASSLDFFLSLDFAINTSREIY